MVFLGIAGAHNGGMGGATTVDSIPPHRAFPVVAIECGVAKGGVLSLLERGHERVDPILKFHGGEGQSLALGLWGNALWGNRLPGLVHGYGHGLGGGHVAMVAWQEEQAGTHCYDDHGGGAPPEQRGLAAWRLLGLALPEAPEEDGERAPFGRHIVVRAEIIGKQGFLRLRGLRCHVAVDQLLYVLFLLIHDVWVIS